MKKVDPRIQRTRQNIMDSFLELVRKRDFNDISIADIAEAAQINRSTFYYHFMDKYDLIDAIQKEIITKELFQEIEFQEAMSEQTIILALQVIINSQTNLSLHCQRAYDAFKPKMDEEIKNRLAQALQQLLGKQFGAHDDHFLKATFWSWGIYGVAMACVQGKETLHVAVNKLSAMIFPIEEDEK